MKKLIVQLQKVRLQLLWSTLSVLTFSKDEASKTAQSLELHFLLAPAGRPPDQNLIISVDKLIFLFNLRWMRRNGTLPSDQQRRSFRKGRRQTLIPRSTWRRPASCSRKANQMSLCWQRSLTPTNQSNS